MKAILERRSIRQYIDKSVDNNVITELLKAAMSAPSAGNQQPWQFLVINDKNTLNKIPEVHPHSAMIRQVSTAILVCGDLDLEVHKGYWVQDCAAATENLLIAIQAMGLGSVWLGVYPREDRVKGMQALLDLPDNVIPFSLLPVGYPAEYLPPSGRFDESKIRYNHW